MAKIDNTAVVNPNAKLGKNVEVGPFAIIHEDVEIGDDCVIGPHAVIYDGARIGNRVKIFQGASVSNLPQDLKFDGGETYFYIGDDTVVREFATLHRGTLETGFSKVGKNVLLMAYSHVAHDCVVGNNCIIANGVQIAGHVNIEDWVIIGGMTPVHQFVNIGQHAMIGGGFRAIADVPPYVLAAGEPLKYSGLNVIGLRRRGFTNDQIKELKEIYSFIYQSKLNISQAKEKIEEKFAGSPLSKIVLEFIKKSSRGIIKR